MWRVAERFEKSLVQGRTRDSHMPQNIADVDFVAEVFAYVLHGSGHVLVGGSCYVSALPDDDPQRRNEQPLRYWIPPVHQLIQQCPRFVSDSLRVRDNAREG